MGFHYFRSLDGVITKEEKFVHIKEYIKVLHNCYLDYQEQWPILKDKINTVDIPTFNIQRYNPGDHFSHIQIFFQED